MRTRQFSLIITCLAAFTPCFASDTSAWYNLQPKGAGFSVKMPAVPVVNSRMIKEDGLTYPAYRYNVAQGNLDYAVAVAAMNVNLSKSQTDQVLQNVIGGIAKIRKASVLHDDAATVQGRQARLFMLQDKSEIDVVGMTCWDGGRNYIITLSGPHNQLNNGIVRSYLMTFKLTSSPK